VHVVCGFSLVPRDPARRRIALCLCSCVCTEHG